MPHRVRLQLEKCAHAQKTLCRLAAPRVRRLWHHPDAPKKGGRHEPKAVNFVLGGSEGRMKLCPNLKSSQGALSLRFPRRAGLLVRGPFARFGSGRFLGANLLAEPLAEPC